MHRILVVLALMGLPAAAFAGEEIVVFEDDFSDLSEWTFFDDLPSGQNHSYALTLSTSNGYDSPPCAQISGDFVGPGGIQGVFGLTHTFEDLRRLNLSFRWRSGSNNAQATWVVLQLANAATGELLYEQSLIAGSVADTGWITYPPTDLSSVLPPEQATDVDVRIGIWEGWSANYGHWLLVDDLVLESGNLPAPAAVPTEVDDFAVDIEPWTKWQQSSNNSYVLDHDTTDGLAAPAARFAGSYPYNSSTYRFGLQREIPIALPFILDLDYRLVDAMRFTVQVYEVGGPLRYTWTPNLEEDWQEFGPVDLSEAVLGMTEAKLRIWHTGAHSSNGPSTLHIDNVSWTEPCAATVPIYEDRDVDGFGDPSVTHPHGDLCYPPTGWTTDGSDCDDDAPLLFPGNTEECNGEDDDCDPTTDLEGTDLDADGDGLLDCLPPEEDDDDSAPPEEDDDDSAPVDDDDATTEGDDDDTTLRDGCTCGTVGGTGSTLLLLLVAPALLTRRRRSGPTCTH